MVLPKGKDNHLWAIFCESANLFELNWFQVIGRSGKQ